MKTYLKLLIFLKKFIIFILAISLIYSCTRVCEPLDRSLLVWAPYSLGDTVIFANDTSIIKNIVRGISMDDDDNTYSGCSKCGCLSYYSIHCYRLFNKEILEYPTLNIYIAYVNSDDVSFDISVRKNEEEYNSGFYERDFTSIENKIIKNYNFKGKIYDEVLILENDSTKNTYWRIILAKNEGVVGFYEKPDKVWEVSVKE